MHRHDSRSPQVNAYFWFRLGRGIPSISTAYAQAWRRCAQVIHMFVHRQQGSSRLVCWQAARIGTVRRYLQARPTRRVRASETRWPPLPGKGRHPPLPGSRRPQVGARPRARPRPRRHRHDQGVSKPEPLPVADGWRILCNLSVAAGIHVSAGAEPRYLCYAGQ
jgi:hypothetical protein